MCRSNTGIFFFLWKKKKIIINKQKAKRKNKANKSQIGSFIGVLVRRPAWSSLISLIIIIEYLQKHYYTAHSHIILVHATLNKQWQR